MPWLSFDGSSVAHKVRKQPTSETLGLPTPKQQYVYIAVCGHVFRHAQLIHDEAGARPVRCWRCANDRGPDQSRPLFPA